MTALDALEEMMSDDTRAILWVLAFLAATGLLMAGFYVVFESTRCKSVATAMGRDYSWGPIQGCLVARQNGKGWLPLSAVREFEK